MLSALRRGLPDVRVIEGSHVGATAAVVGAGPSANDALETLRYWKGPVIACEKIAPQLKAEGIAVDVVLALDASPDVAASIAAGPSEAFYVLSLQCAPAAFDALGSRAAAHLLNVMKDVDLDEALELGDVTLVNTGASVTIGCASIAIIMGCRRVEVFGFDCHLGGGAYAAGATGVGVEPQRVPMEVGERTFLTTWAYYAFAEEMLQLRALGMRLGHLEDLRIHGDSLACAISVEDVRAAA